MTKRTARHYQTKKRPNTLTHCRLFIDCPQFRQSERIILYHSLIYRISRAMARKKINISPLIPRCTPTIGFNFNKSQQLHSKEGNIYIRAILISRESGRDAFIKNMFCTWHESAKHNKNTYSRLFSSCLYAYLRNSDYLAVRSARRVRTERRGDGQNRLFRPQAF